MDSYEIERNMFKNIRKIQEEVLLKEQEELQQGQEQPAQENTEGQEPNEGDGGSVKPNDADYQTEIKKFKTQITSRVDINTFLIYPDTKNVVFGGTFNDISEFSFEMSLSEKDGLYINCDNLQITDDIVNRIQKLNGFYKNWAEEWANKVISEYKNV